MRLVVGEDRGKDGGGGGCCGERGEVLQSSGDIKGYVNVQASAEGGREADHVRAAAVLKALGQCRKMYNPGVVRQ
jgi:hypothetical protein